MVTDADGKRISRPARRDRGQFARPRPPGGRRGGQPSRWHTGPCLEFLHPPEGARPRRAAARIISGAEPDARVLFCNSGAEANEAAFKIARLTGRPGSSPAEGRFHGRTMGALALTGQPPSGRRSNRCRPGSSSSPTATSKPAARRDDSGRRRVPRADPRRGRRGHPLPDGYLAAAREITARTAHCWSSTRCRPASAAPAPGSPSSRPGSARTSSRWPRAWAAGCPSARSSGSGRRPTLLSAGPTRLDLRRQPGHVRPRLWRCWPPSKASTCSTTSRPSASTCPPRSRICTIR